MWLACGSGPTGLASFGLCEKYIYCGRSSAALWRPQLYCKSKSQSRGTLLQVLSQRSTYQSPSFPAADLFAHLAPSCILTLCFTIWVFNLIFDFSLKPWFFTQNWIFPRETARSPWSMLFDVATAHSICYPWNSIPIWNGILDDYRLWQSALDLPPRPHLMLACGKYHNQRAITKIPQEWCRPGAHPRECAAGKALWT